MTCLPPHRPPSMIFSIGFSVAPPSECRGGRTDQGLASAQGGVSIPRGCLNLRQVPRPRSQARRPEFGRPLPGGICPQASLQQGHHCAPSRTSTCRTFAVPRRTARAAHVNRKVAGLLQDWLCQQKSCGSAGRRGLADGASVDSAWSGSESRSSAVSLLV